MHPKIKALSEQANVTASLARSATNGSLTPAMAAISTDASAAGKSIFTSVSGAFSEIRKTSAGQTAEAVRARLSGVWADAVSSVAGQSAEISAAPSARRPRMA